jgi:hypothetical protein
VSLVLAITAGGARVDVQLNCDLVEVEIHGAHLVTHHLDFANGDTWKADGHYSLETDVDE